MNAPTLTRRRFTGGLGALVVTFSLDPNLALAQERLPGSLQNNRKLDGWIRINPDGTATIFTGKVELGQGILTALAQIAAEEIDLPLARVRMISGDTRQTPNEGQTAGSQSVENSGTALRMACAEARAILIDLAAKRLGVAADQLKVADGVVSAPDGRKIGYGELNPDLNREATAKATPKPPASHKIVGKSIPRFDIPAKVTGGLVYVQDMRPAGMLHGRVIRPPRYGSKLDSADETAAKAIPGVVAVVRDGSFLGVVAEREEQAIKAREALRQEREVDIGTRTARSRANLRGDQVAAQQGCDHRRQAGRGTSRCSHVRGGLHQALHVARFDRSILLGRRVQGWADDGMDALAGRLSVARRARQSPENAGRRDPVRPCGGLRLLRPQRRRRRSRRRGAAGARGARPAGPPAMDARRRVRLGAVWPGHGDARQGGAGRRWQDRRLGIRGVEQQPLDTAGIDRRHQCAGRLVSRRAAEDGTADEPAATCRRRRPQRHSALRLSRTSG